MNPNIKINDILTAIQSINEKQKSLDGELESLLMTRNELENKIDLITFLPELDKIKQNSDHLTTNINKTSESAVALSSKVGEILTSSMDMMFTRRN